jgi:hypothetical protein
MTMKRKHPATPAAIVPAPTGVGAAALAAPAAHASTTKTVLPPLRSEVAALSEIFARIEQQVGTLGPNASPSDARRVALQIDSEIMRASLRLGGLRTKASALAQHAHVAELQAMADEVKA